MRDEAQRLGLVMDQQALKESEAFTDAMTKLSGILKGVFLSFSTQLMPMIREWTDRLREWVEGNRALIGQRITQLVEGLSKGLKPLLEMIMNALITLPKYANEIASVFTMIVKVVGGFAAIIGVILIGWREMGKAIGNLFGFLFVSMEKFDKAVGSGLRWLISFIGQIHQRAVNWLADLLGRINVFKTIANIFSGIAQAGKNAIMSLWNAFTGFFSGIWGYLKALPSAVWQAIVSGFSAAIAWVQNKIIELNAWLSKKLGKVWTMLGGGGGEISPKINVKAEIAKDLFGSVAAAKMAPSLGFAPAETPGVRGSPVTYQPTINVNVPPGTPASEAERVADATSRVSTQTFRRAMGDIRRR
jgi:hypothetical protein